MTDKATGRNALCPCGSGLKFKKCCLLTGQPAAAESGPADTLREALQGQEFASLAELQAFCSDHTQAANRRPRDEFQGLSPQQMHHVLNFPFACPSLIDMPDILDSAPSAPVVRLFSMMADAIGDHGIKATAKGNLPRQLCRDAATAFRVEAADESSLMFRSISGEEDFPELHVTRLVAGLAGLIRKYKGKLILSRRCKSLLDSHGMAAIYPLLHRAYIEQFNWGYMDRHPELHFVQRSSFYSLYLLTHFGDPWRPQTFYEDCFLHAFPGVVDEAPSDGVFSQAVAVRHCYSLRTLQRYVGFFGLGAVEPVSQQRFSREYRVRSLPLLQDAVRFRTAPVQASLRAENPR